MEVLQFWNWSIFWFLACLGLFIYSAITESCLKNEIDELQERFAGVKNNMITYKNQFYEAMAEVNRLRKKNDRFRVVVYKYENFWFWSVKSRNGSEAFHCGTCYKFKSQALKVAKSIAEWGGGKVEVEK